MNVLLVNDAQRDTILAALRFYQAALARNDDLIPEEIADIATNCDAHESLGAEDIDDLCVGINGGDNARLGRLLVTTLAEVEALMLRIDMKDPGVAHWSAQRTADVIRDALRQAESVEGERA